MTLKMASCLAAALALGLCATPASAGGKWRCCDNGAPAYHYQPNYYYAPSYQPYYAATAYSYYVPYPTYYQTYPAVTPNHYQYDYGCHRRVRRCCD